MVLNAVYQRVQACQFCGVVERRLREKLVRDHRPDLELVRQFEGGRRNPREIESLRYNGFLLFLGRRRRKPERRQDSIQLPGLTVLMRRARGERNAKNCCCAQGNDHSFSLGELY